MISVQDALAHINAVRPTTTVETVAVTEAIGRVLTDDLPALLDMPPFLAANMDGYATSECQSADRMNIIGESAAGHPFAGHVSESQAVRISTGAMLPSGAERVLMQEHVNRIGNEITVKLVSTSEKHVRAAASDFVTGTILLKAGHRLHAGDLTLAAAAGHFQIRVLRKCKVAMFSSGDELQPVGKELPAGQIYAANSVGLKPLLERWGADVTNLGIVKDSPEAISSLLSQVADYDIILPIGGASVGDHDHMRPSFRDAGFQVLFETVAVRPGKPSWMGKKINQIVFGLPGNPASAFVCAHLFLRPVLGIETTFLPASLDNFLEENGARESYLRGQAFIRDGQLCVKVDNPQESFRLRPQSDVNALIKIPPLGGPYLKGDQVKIMLIGELDHAG